MLFFVLEKIKKYQIPIAVSKKLCYYIIQVRKTMKRTTQIIVKFESY